MRRVTPEAEETTRVVLAQLAQDGWLEPDGTDYLITEKLVGLMFVLEDARRIRRRVRLRPWA